MPINKEKKKKIISDFHRDRKDTGSADVQVALLTTRIKSLTEHFRVHTKRITAIFCKWSRFRKLLKQILDIIDLWHTATDAAVWYVYVMINTLYRGYLIPSITRGPTSSCDLRKYQL